MEIKEKSYIPLIRNNALFQGFDEAEIKKTLETLNAQVKSFKKDEFVYHEGERNVKAAIVMEGSLHIIKEDFWGNRSLIARLSAGELFAESFACCPETPLNVSVTAETDCRILWLDAAAMLCGGGALVQKLVSEISFKNLMLSEKLTHLGKRTTRTKLLSYLSAAAQRKNSREFEIPFTRQQLADYLLVERSAMSAELGRLKKDGVIDFERNRFILKS